MVEAAIQPLPFRGGDQGVGAVRQHRSRQRIWALGSFPTPTPPLKGRGL